MQHCTFKSQNEWKQCVHSEDSSFLGWAKYNCVLAVGAASKMSRHRELPIEVPGRSSGAKDLRDERRGNQVKQPVHSASYSV